MAQGDIVNLLQSNNIFRNEYIAELVEGDRYNVPINILPPRSADQILEFVAEHKLGFEWNTGVNGKTESLTITQDQSFDLVTYPYSENNLNTMIEAVEYIMDNEEL